MFTSLRNSLVLSTLFLLVACRFDAQDVSEKSLVFLKAEKDSYDKLKQEYVAQELALVDSPTGYSELLKRGSDVLLHEYLPLLQVIEKDLLRPLAKYNEEDVRDNLSKVDVEELKKIREQDFPKHKELLNLLLNRNANLQLTLKPWEISELQKYVRSLELVKYEDNVLSVSLPEKGLASLLNFVFLPEQNPDLNFKFTIKIRVADQYYDTQKDCLALVEELKDTDCKNDASAVCGPQMDLKKVTEVVQNYKNSFCRELKTSYFIDREEQLRMSSKFVKNSNSYKLVSSMLDSVSKTAVLR